jgi:hypothetical protein
LCVVNITAQAFSHLFALTGKGHIPHCRYTTGQRGAATDLKIVSPTVDAWACSGWRKMDMGIDPTWHDKHSFGVDLSLTRHNPTELHDATTIDSYICDRSATRCCDSAVFDD